MHINKNEDQPKDTAKDLASQTLYHGTKADLKTGDLIQIGFNSNYGKNKKAKYIYVSATLEAATWGAELALGQGIERIYIVEPTGAIEDDPNLTDKDSPATQQSLTVHCTRLRLSVRSQSGRDILLHN